jgi:hypothetical protein
MLHMLRQQRLGVAMSIHSHWTIRQKGWSLNPQRNRDNVYRNVDNYVQEQRLIFDDKVVRGIDIHKAAIDWYEAVVNYVNSPTMIHTGANKRSNLEFLAGIIATHLREDYMFDNVHMTYKGVLTGIKAGSMQAA